MKKPGTPFPTIGYYGAKFFCDREQESADLIRNIRAGQSTVITSIRRMGKTGLLKHVLAQLPKGWKDIYIDILPSETLEDFLNTLASAVLQAFPDKSGFGSKLWDAIKTFRPVISYDALSGSPQVSFDFKAEDSEKNLSMIFSILERYESKVVVAIDEFQQILQYPQKNTESYLRSIIQQLNNVTFLFSGSQQHLMDQIFSLPSSPFYRSTSYLALSPIKQSMYAEFIVEQFRTHKKTIHPDDVWDMLHWTNTHTFYVQMLMSRVFIASGKVVTPGDWRGEARKILLENEHIFMNYRELLTKQQWQLLKAVAKEGEAYHPTSSDFCNRYKLGNPSTVLRALNALKSKELIYSAYNKEGKSFVSVYDVFFRRWAENLP